MFLQELGKINHRALWPVEFQQTSNPSNIFFNDLKRFEEAVNNTSRYYEPTIIDRRVTENCDFKTAILE